MTPTVSRRSFLQTVGAAVCAAIVQHWPKPAAPAVVGPLTESVPLDPLYVGDWLALDVDGRSWLSQIVGIDTDRNFAQTITLRDAPPSGASVVVSVGRRPEATPLRDAYEAGRRTQRATRRRGMPSEMILRGGRR